MPTSSELSAEIVIVPATVDPSAGDDMAIDGGVVSDGGRTSGTIVSSRFCRPGGVRQVRVG